MARYIEKFSRLKQIIRENGGVMGSVKELFYSDELKTGNLVGVDPDGNQYFENKMYFMGRSRWVKYSPKYGFDYDGSQIPAEWHRWLHYMTDDAPTKVPLTSAHWMARHTENMSGTSGEYVPYSTVRPKIEPWTPKKCGLCEKN